MTARPFLSLPARAARHAREDGARPAHYYNAGGRWVPVGWRTVHRSVTDLASGLIELGHKKGDPVAIVSDTRREWLYADLATLSAGGVTVGVYPTLTSEQVEYIIAHSEARFCVVENAAQLRKLVDRRSSMPKLEHVILIDAAEVDVGSDAKLMTLGQLRSLGASAGHDVPARIDEIAAEDAATFVYTSGTTGPPKGAMLTHGNIIAALESLTALELYDHDFGLSFLPLAHVLQRSVDYTAVFRGAPCGAFGRGIPHLADDIAELGPSVMAAVPRVFEKIFHGIRQAVEDGPPARRRVFDWAVEVGKEVAALKRAHRPLPKALRWQHAVADRLVFSKLRARLGGRPRVFISGGAPIAVEILDFFEAAGISVLEGWGMTETFSAGTMNLPGAVRPGSIGRPLPGIELKLDDDGELLIRGPNVFAGYYKQEHETAQAFTEDGFFRTGDIARVDDDGFYYIVDRKKDLIITAGGKNIAPQNIENQLKGTGLIEQAVIIGDRRPYLVALVSPTEGASERWSEEELGRRLQFAVEQVNRDLPRFEQIKAFRLLPEPLSQERGELTPTLKVKRARVEEQYRELIEEMYEPREESAERRERGAS